MDIRKRAAFLLILYNLIIYKYFNNFNKSDLVYYPDYSQENINPYARCNGKDIYIVNDEEFIIPSDSCIKVIDSRYDCDPNMKIIDSYLINDLREMRNILTVLKRYESDFPSNWNRTILSMEYEWILHNICYKFGYDKFSTKDVDLNNNDEKILIPKSRK